MMQLFALLFGLIMQQESRAPSAATHISAAEIAATLEQSVTNRVVDQAMKGADVTGGKVLVALLHRTSPETNALAHDQVTEIYEIVSGAGTLVTGGSILDPKPSDLTRVGAGMSHTGAGQGGDSRRIGPHDVVIIPAGTPHRFSQLEGPITYLVYRFDPAR